MVSTVKATNGSLGYVSPDAVNFIPLTPAWKSAIVSAFYTGTSENLAIGNTNVCNTKGRP